jgi:predicted aspartyl protease
MRVATGSLDAEGTPRLWFELSAERFDGERAGTYLEGVIDTGFVGFVSMPLPRAFPLKLALAGRSVIRLADGSSGDRFTCTGHARIGERSEEIAVILEPASQEVLIGVALLRALGLALLVTRDEVLLLDQDAIDDFRGFGPGTSCVRDSSSTAYDERAYLS